MATDFTKDWGSVIGQGVMNDTILRWYRHLEGKGPALDDEAMARLRSVSIDEAMARRIGYQLENKGAQFKSILLANSGEWDDEAAQRFYRGALLRLLHRTVITPGVADRPNWMSTELGSLVMQFRTFGASSAIRTTYAGLQEKGYKFWTGAAVLVGAAAVMNEIRKQVFYDKSSFDQPYMGVLVDAIDRSGVLGIFMDVNNATEILSGGDIGLRPQLVGRGRQQPLSRVANSLGGPVAGQITAGVDVVGNIMQGDLTANTWRRMRGFVPGQNLFWADPVFDQLFPAANGKSGRLSEVHPGTVQQPKEKSVRVDPKATAFNKRFPPPPPGSAQEAEEKIILYGQYKAGLVDRETYLNDRHAL
jgi:hypothetical protein